MSVELYFVSAVINPFIDLLVRLSDLPKLSVTRICAYDFGSAPRSLKVLKKQAAVFALAARCANLHSKPYKCVSIITACSLTEHLVASIQAWLSVNVPEGVDSINAESGIVLGWHLKRQSAVLSFAPLSKSSLIGFKKL